ncbi:MAG: hypothetical protein HYX53_13515 [Chloroflexi bacterium]|nr:hypothetical protein [Chloroflexota bacterium]
MARIRRQDPAYDGRSGFYSVVLGLLIFFLLLAVSLSQATAPGTARTVLEDGISSLTEADLLVAQYGDALRDQARASNDASFAVPGYPIEIFLTKQELLTLSNGQLRDLLLERSSAVVYTSGLGAFDRTGNQSLSTFSSEGVLEQLVGLLSDDTHAKARVATIVLALLAAGAAVLVVLRNDGFGRMRSLGVAAFAGALPGWALFYLIGRLAGRAGGGDRFSRDIRTIVQSVIDIPTRNYLIVAITGAAIAAIAVVLSLATRQSAGETQDAAADGVDDYEGYDGDWYEPETYIGRGR